MGTNRTGRVSSIDYEHGTYEVTYFDRGKSVTRQINGISNGEYKMPKIGQMVTVVHNSNGTAAATAMGTMWNKHNKPPQGWEGLFRKEFSDQNGDGYESYDSNTGEYKLHSKSSSGRSSGYIHDNAGGNYQVTAGGAARIKSEKAMQLFSGEDQVQTVKGDQTITVDGKKEETAQTAVLNYPDGLTINVGGAVIKITAGGFVQITSPLEIELKAPNITIEGAAGDVKVKSISLTEHTHENAGEGKPK